MKFSARRTLQRGGLLGGLGGEEAEELGELAAVLSVLVDTELDVLAERLVELVEVVLVLRNLGDEVHALLDEVLADDLENLVLLQRLTRDVERQILGVDDTLDEVEVLGDEVLAVVHDEDAADVELDVVALLLGLEEVEGCALGDVEDGLELELTLDGEVLDGKVLLPVVGQALVEGGVLLGGDLGGVARPDGLGLVELLVLDGLLLDLLGLFLLLLLLVLNLFDLRLIFRLLLSLFFVLDLLWTGC